MALKAYKKETMSDEQIESFRNFYAAYTQNAEKMNTLLDEIEEALTRIIEFGKKTLCYI
jgi:ppGpp synthetase/RelA/SpoT-type nucleotidyltranferase